MSLLGATFHGNIIEGLTIEGLTIEGLTIEGLTIEGLTMEGLTGPVMGVSPTGLTARRVGPHAHATRSASASLRRHRLLAFDYSSKVILTRE